MTDGDPDVFLTASHLRDVLRRMMFVKTAPVYISLCVKYLSTSAQTPIAICNTGATEILSFWFQAVTSLSVSVIKF